MKEAWTYVVVMLKDSLQYVQHGLIWATEIVMVLFGCQVYLKSTTQRVKLSL